MLILIKGAGDIATGIAVRLKNAGMQVVMTEIAIPTTVRRSVAFSRAVYEGSAVVENITARLVLDFAQIPAVLQQDEIPVLIDPRCEVLKSIHFDAVVDSILAKKNLSTNPTQAPVVIGVGPGFSVPQDCHCVIETQRGHDLGRCIYQGCAAKNTGIPGEIGGYTVERLLRAPCDGIFHPILAIGDIVKAGQTVAMVDDQPVTAQINGIVRGLLQDNVPVKAGMKSGDIDPRGCYEHCFTVSDKARAVGGGVLEAILHLGLQNR
ncbi:MAG: EF2563 family selenium-dependent molybdenum hydroxylase system protein [Negativibacillus massiliensis]|nr:EF2563 family selenium-dependent molybdenum hydroxylase system protein [Negativibacillus massiliensis]